MKTILLLLVGAVIGAVVGVFLFSGVLTGVGAGVGIITGLKAGACLTVEAAKEQGLVTAEQVDDVLNAAARLIAAEDLGDEASLSGGDAECARVVADLKAAASQ